MPGHSRETGGCGRYDVAASVVSHQVAGGGGGPVKAPEPEKEPRASTTDAQARVMKMADGGFRPAYNVQFAADTRSMAVAGVSVDNVGSDMGKMAPMNDALAAAYGRRPSQHLADGGFAKLKDIEELNRTLGPTWAPIVCRWRPEAALVIVLDGASMAK